MQNRHIKAIIGFAFNAHLSKYATLAGWGAFEPFIGLAWACDIISCYGYHFGGLNLPASPNTFVYVKGQLQSCTITTCDWLGSYI